MEDVAVINLNAGPAAMGAPATASESDPPAIGARLSFFAVFDGHGGSNVARFAANNLHAAVLKAGLAAEAERLAAGPAGAAGSPPDQAKQQQQQQQPPQARKQDSAPAAATAAAAAAVPAPGVKRCRAAIAEGFRELDRQVLDKCGSEGWPDGCTAVAAWVLADTVFVANIGDARCVLARTPADAAATAAAVEAAARQGGSAADGQQGGGRGQAGTEAGARKQDAPQQAQQAHQAQQAQQACLPPLKAITLTREHKAIFPAERQRIEQAGSFVSGDGRLAGRIEVSRGFGDKLYKRSGMTATPDIQAFQISERDAFLLLACDGFWGVFSPQDAVDFAQRELRAKGNGAKQTCNRLLHEAVRERRCKDNCTVMLVLLHEHGTA